jgi:mono/diheme cytochrome c family protein
MFMFSRELCSIALGTLAGVWVAGVGSSHAWSQGGQSTHHQEAAKMENPVKPDATSVAAGKKLYDQLCVECHGEKGKGDGPRAPHTDPKPPDLTDAEWKHGSTDGVLFVVIRDGVDGTEMPAFGPKGEKIADRQLWDVVNYVRSLGSAPQKGP